MLANRIIPSLLLRAGRLVKGVAFAAWRDAGKAESTVRAYNAQRADELILLDIDASAESRGPDLQVVRSVAAECEMPLTVGGGIRSLETASACLAAGADKLCLTTTALDRPALLTELSRAFGSQAVVAGVDVVVTDDTPALYDHRTKRVVEGRRWLEWIHEAVDRGAGEIRLMRVDREGTRGGLDHRLHEQVSKEVNVPIILEGGAGSLRDIDTAMGHGVDSVALGTMLVFSDNNIFQVKRYLKNAGHPIRL